MVGDKVMSRFTYILNDDMNNKMMLRSDDWFLLNDYKTLNNMSDNMGFSIRGVDIVDCDYEMLDAIRKVKVLRLDGGV